MGAGDIPKQFSSIWAQIGFSLQISGGFEEVPLPPRLTSSPITFDRLFCRSRRSASRDKPITRPIPQSARERRRAGLSRCCLSLRLEAARAPTRAREFGGRTGSGRLACRDSRVSWLSSGEQCGARTRTAQSCVERSWCRSPSYPRLEPHPSAQLCQPELLTDPPSPAPKGEKKRPGKSAKSDWEEGMWDIDF